MPQARLHAQSGAVVDAPTAAIALNLAAIGCLLGGWQFARKAQTYEMMHDELAEKLGIDPDAGEAGGTGGNDFAGAEALRVCPY